MLNYLQKWMDQLKWQRLRPFEKLADMLVTHLEGILNYCRTKVPMGVVEALNGNLQILATPRAGLWQPSLSPAESTADGGNQDRNRRFQEGRLKCVSRQILAESPFTKRFSSASTRVHSTRTSLPYLNVLSRTRILADCSSSTL